MYKKWYIFVIFMYVNNITVIHHIVYVPNIFNVMVADRFPRVAQTFEYRLCAD